MQGIQLLLGAVIVILTALLFFVGIQVILILRDARTVVKRVHELLVKEQSGAFSPSYPLVPTARRFPGLTLFSFLTQLFTKHQSLPDNFVGVQMSSYEYDLHAQAGESKSQTDDVMKPQTSDDFNHITALQERGRRSGHRLGEPLGSERWTPGLEGRRVFYREGKPLA